MNTVATWTTILTVWLGLIGQTLFIALYATRPWRKFRVTRALMIKSASIWMIFALGATRHVVTGQVSSNPVANENVGLVIFTLALDALIIFAIWYQFFALVDEVRKGWLTDASTPLTPEEQADQ